MTDDIKIINLKVTKVQETETETESGTTNKWTYTLQDEEKENTVTLKTSLERNIYLGDTVDVRIGNDQTTLGSYFEDSVTSTEDAEEDKEPEEELDLDDKQDAIKAGKKKQKTITDDDRQELEESVPMMPASAKEDLEKLESNKDSPVTFKNVTLLSTGTRVDPGVDAPLFYTEGALDRDPPKDNCKPKIQKDKKITIRLEQDEKLFKKFMISELHTQDQLYDHIHKWQGAAPESKPFVVTTPSQKFMWDPKKGSPTATPFKEKETKECSLAPNSADHPYSQLFLGITYEYPTTHKGKITTKEIGIVESGGLFGAMWINEKTGGTHKIRSKDLGMHKTRGAAQRELNTWAAKKSLELIRDNTEPEPNAPEKVKEGMTEEEKAEQLEIDNQEYKASNGTLLVKKDDFPEDLCGGLKEDVKVEKTENGERILYAHAKTVKTPQGPDDSTAVQNKLKELTGYDWKHTIGTTFNCDKNQLNKIKEGE